jgi:hypothetical protein
LANQRNFQEERDKNGPADLPSPTMSDAALLGNYAKAETKIKENVGVPKQQQEF